MHAACFGFTTAHGVGHLHAEGQHEGRVVAGLAVAQPHALSHWSPCSSFPPARLTPFHFTLANPAPQQRVSRRSAGRCCAAVGDPGHMTNGCRARVARGLSREIVHGAGLVGGQRAVLREVHGRQRGPARVGRCGALEQRRPAGTATTIIFQMQPSSFC